MPLYKHMYTGKYSEYLSTWGNDEECEGYEDRIDAWLEQFDEEDKPLMLRLLKNFKMYRGHLLSIKINDLFSLFIKKYPQWENDSIFIEVKKEEKAVGNSDAFFTDFWRVTGIRQWSKRIITKEEIEDKLLSHIIMVDDYVGSGRTVITNLDNLIEAFPSLKFKRITLLCLVCSKSAEIALKNYNIKAKLNLDIIFAEKYGKAFSNDEIFSIEELKTILPRYNGICNEYNLIHPRGFNDVEALIGFDYGAPNNTLGICWEKHGSRKKFQGFWYRREKEIPTPDSMLQAKKARRIQANKGVFKNVTEDLNDYFFMGCCIASKKKFDVNKLLKQFGLTQAQFDTKMNYCLDNEYIQLVDGAFMATPKFLDNVKSQYKNFFKKIINGDFGEGVTRQNLEVEYNNYFCNQF